MSAKKNVRHSSRIEQRKYLKSSYFAVNWTIFVVFVFIEKLSKKNENFNFHHKKMMSHCRVCFVRDHQAPANEGENIYDYRNVSRKMVKMELNLSLLLWLVKRPKKPLSSFPFFSNIYCKPLDVYVVSLNCFTSSSGTFVVFSMFVVPCWANSEFSSVSFLCFIVICC